MMDKQIFFMGLMMFLAGIFINVLMAYLVVTLNNNYLLEFKFLLQILAISPLMGIFMMGWSFSDPFDKKKNNR